MATTNATTSASAGRRVVLHFDLNRTVLMSDAAGGRTMENTVDYLLSECTWGFVDAQDPAKWVCVSEASSIAPPAAPEGRALVSYKQFVDDAHPYKSLAGASESIEDVKAFNKAAKKKRTALQSAFTGGADAPGARVRASFDEVMQRLHFPAGAVREAAQALAATLPKSRLQEAWSEGRYYLLPSFIDFLFFLAGKEHEHDVKLVFRTFGDDIPEVAAELGLLADGKHPYASGRALPASFKLDAAAGSHRIGTFYRDGFDANGSVLAVGSLTKVPFSSARQGDEYAVHDFYASLPQAPSVEISRGFEAIQAKIDKMLKDESGARTIALRDYWEWWSAHAEAGEYGKLLLVSTDEAGAANGDLAVFFDDHIEAHHSHIVDVRDVASGAPVPFEQSKGKYLQRVEPFAAITDPNYFISLFQQIIARQ